MDDAEELHRLIIRAYAPDLSLNILFHAGVISMEEMVDHIKYVPTFVGENEHHIVVTVSIRLPWTPNSAPFRLPHLGWVATVPEEKRKGYAKAIIDWIVMEVLKKDYHAPAVTLGTAGEHPWLQDMYQKIGFQVLGQKRLFPDHVTVYMLRIVDNRLFERWKSKNISEFQSLLK
ncbi:MAG: GNAT family N-acetyltransferase [Sporolactobacillus sp.]